MPAVKKPPVAAKSVKKTAGIRATPSTPVAAPAPAAVKAAVRPVVPAAPQAAAKAPKPADWPQAPAAPTSRGEPAKVKKPKLVRDSFTIPKNEYAVLDDLKQRAVRLSRPARKSELLRAGVKALAAMPDAAFLSALRVVPVVKTGRPSKS